MLHRLVTLSLATTLVASEDLYITRKIGGQIRHCIPTYDCNPGHEVLPCPENFTEDVCQECPTGYVQPAYISSSIDKDTTCFKPKGQCLGYDVEDSRKSVATCDFHAFCQCKTDSCYYGDPCFCNQRIPECGIGETMDINGDCIPCPAGTEKNETGCGPCRHTKGPKIEVIGTTKATIDEDKNKKPNLRHKIMVGELALQDKEQLILNLKIKLLKKLLKSKQSIFKIKNALS